MELTFAKMELAIANLTAIVLQLKTSVDTLSEKMSSKSKKASKRNILRIKAKRPTIRSKGRSPSILASRSGAVAEEANILPILYDSYDSQTSLKSKTKKALYMVAKNGGYGKLVAVPVVGLLTSKLNRDLITLDCVAIDQYGYELSVGWPKKAYAVASKSSPEGPWSSCVALFADKKSSKQMTRSMNAAFDEKDMREKKNRFTDDSYLDYKSVPVLVEKLLG
jgi:hypothetical protein